MKNDNISQSNTICLSEKQNKEFSSEIMVAIYKQLYENGFLSDIQLRELLRLHGR